MCRRLDWKKQPPQERNFLPLSSGQKYFGKFIPGNTASHTVESTYNFPTLRHISQTSMIFLHYDICLSFSDTKKDFLLPHNKSWLYFQIAFLVQNINDASMLQNFDKIWVTIQNSTFPHPHVAAAHSRIS